MLDKNVETFILHVTSLNLSLILIYPTKKAQIVLLLAKEVKIPVKYSDFSNVFSKKKALILLKLTKFN